MPESNWGIQYDAQRRPFFWMNGVVGGKKNYVSPVAMGGQAPADTTGIFRQRPQWNNKKGKWETPIDWGNILNIGVGAGLGVGAASAFGAFGATAAEAAGGATTAGTGATAAGTGATTAGTVATVAKAGFGARDWLDLALFGGSTIANIAGTRAANASSDRAAEAQLQASREALAFLKEQWAQDRADFAPYLEAGRGALGRINEGMAGRSAGPLPEHIARGALGPRGPAPTTRTYGDLPVLDRTRDPERVGIPGGWRGPEQPAFSVGRTGPGGQHYDFGMTPPADSGPTVLGPGAPDAMMRGQPGVTRGYGQALPGQPPPLGGALKLVRMQAPTGEVQDVPADRQWWFELGGAKAVA